jgi:RNA polymerase sigma-70 factor (ECF subfamily)
MQCSVTAKEKHRVPLAGWRQPAQEHFPIAPLPRDSMGLRAHELRCARGLGRGATVALTGHDALESPCSRETRVARGTAEEESMREPIAIVGIGGRSTGGARRTWGPHEPAGAHDDRPLRTRPELVDVFRELAPFVRRAARHLGAPVSDLDDVCQEVFIVVHRRLPTYDASQSLRGWVWGILSNVVRSHRRRAYRRYETPSEWPPERESTRAAPDEDAAHRQAIAKLERFVASLDADKRTVFVLSELEEMAMHEVATIAGCPVNTAYSRLRAARAALERFLDEETPADTDAAA